MKKIIAVATCAALALGMVGCAQGQSDDQGGSEQAQQEQKAPLDLTGSWRTTNSASEDSWMDAEIEGGTITVWWGAEDSKSLYWAGTYEAPTDSADTYSWVSVNDKSQTDTALMASGDDTKEFSYANGVLSCDVTALGTTKTMTFERI